MNTKLKKAAMKKAREEGWTLSAMLNQATKAYVNNHLQPIMLDPRILQGLDDIQHGRVFSHEQMIREVRERLVQERQKKSR